MIGEKSRRAAAAALQAARLERVPIAPVTETWPEFDLADAYAVQSLLIEERLRGGAISIGWKVGLTSEAMQQQLGVSEPDFGPLLDEMQHASGSTLDIGGLIAPRVEGELAFRLCDELRGPDVDAATAADAVDVVVPALEIIDSRIADWRLALPDTVADHASCAAFVLGSGGARLDAIDLEGVGLTILEDGREVGAGVGRAVLGNPLNAVVWLANTLAAYGESLAAGHVILAGALHASIPVRAGVKVEARYTEPALEPISIGFA